MPLRPARCYKGINKPAYTRSEYIDGIPQSKIVKYVMGNLREKYELRLELKALEAAQIRHNALEAGRIAAHKYLSKAVGEDKFALIVRVYPHQVLRENKMMAFAGADRLQEGMRRAFGKPIGLAARVFPNSTVVEVRVNRAYLEQAKEALRRFSDKIGVPSAIEITDLSKVSS
ncbi:MAG: 50S ribosomal protein L16 [Sulfolobales archaeon]|nr:50S ribosomal protein L16 [Sulfolobales archaeon]MCX8208514.1 50S ribosomal protein L16 [Sulfolobales archaeon]MDW8010578.1 50S ribosomal protein L16 [Sulfolobales archaeon]